jgi:pilus assembly protein CpaB
MNWKTWVPLLLAIVLGLAAMLVARGVMSKDKDVTAEAPGTTLVVLKNALPPGSAITSEDVATARVTGDFSTEEVFTQPEALFTRVLVAQGIKGSPVIGSMLAPVGTATGMAALIPAGMRAITIEIDEFRGVAGNLQPGSRVDLVSTLPADGQEGMVTRTIVQNIKVQSLGARAAANGEPAPVRSVTLLATPKEAEAIELVASTGRPRLVLRGGNDQDVELSDGTSVSELRGDAVRFNTDPFIASGPTPLPTPAIAPSTQPADPSSTVRTTASARPTPRTRRRSVSVIRAGQEDVISFEEPISPAGAKWMTSADTDAVVDE